MNVLETLTKACPAGLYKKQEDGSVRFDYAGCLECGTCRILGLDSALENGNTHAALSVLNFVTADLFSITLGANNFESFQAFIYADTGMHNETKKF